MATPAIRSLRLGFSEAHLAVVIKSYALPLLDGSPYIDEILECDPNGKHRGILGYYRFLYGLRQRDFGLGVVLPNSFRAAWELRVAGVKCRVGYARQGRGWLLTDPVPPPRDGKTLRIVNMVDYYLGLCTHLGCTQLDRREELFTIPEAEATAEAILGQHGFHGGEMLIGIAPGAGYGPSKLYPIERYAKVLNRLVEAHECRILIITSPKEADLAQALSSQLRRPAIRLDDQRVDLNVLKSLVKRLSLLITNDTGPRHIAVAFDKPVVVVFGPTSTAYTDVNLERQVIVRQEVECSPCQLKVCPTDHRCMTRLEPEKVYQAAETLIRRYVIGDVSPDGKSPGT
jgi:heptosyltransferase-2